MKLTPIADLPDVQEGDNLVEIFYDKLHKCNINNDDNPILCVAHKIISKAERQTRSLSEVSPTDRAIKIADESEKSPALIQLILDYSKKILHVENGTIIAETPHGFVCANAGIDTSNVKGEKTALLIPEDPDRSARELSDGLEEALGARIPVIITDTWGRPWRDGQVNFAIGVHGLEPIKDYRGTLDQYGNELKTSKVAIADELAAASELLMGKSKGVPAVLMTGYDFEEGDGTGQNLVRDSDEDFFR
jgi:coenzyme F420-0:L-glutamate ligase/coenzyme F420-1:gamma-L-glutamate ligase